MFWQQDVPSHMSVDVINRCLSNKQALPERNILCLKIPALSWVGLQRLRSAQLAPLPATRPSTWLILQTCRRPSTRPLTSLVKPVRLGNWTGSHMRARDTHRPRRRVEATESPSRLKCFLTGTVPQHSLCRLVYPLGLLGAF